jgi:hypothetical protein
MAEQIGEGGPDEPEQEAEDEIPTIGDLKE